MATVIFTNNWTMAFWFTKVSLFLKKMAGAQFHFSCFCDTPFIHWPWTLTEVSMWNWCPVQNNCSWKAKTHIQLKDWDSKSKPVHLCYPLLQVLTQVYAWPQGQAIQKQRPVDSGEMRVPHQLPLLVWITEHEWPESTAAVPQTETHRRKLRARALFVVFQKKSLESTLWMMVYKDTSLTGKCP